MDSSPPHAVGRHDDSPAAHPSGQELQPAVVSVPPYWHLHRRGASYASTASSTRPAPIRLEDNTDEPEGVKSPLWARLVTIESHTVVSGNVKGIGDYVVWNCQVETLDVSCLSFKCFWVPHAFCRRELYILLTFG